MRIYTPAGDLAFKTFSFPDGQPHFKLETYELDFTRVTIELAIKSSLELFQLSLAVDVLRNHGYSEINLDVRYLLGARMDRAIDTLQPHTLQCVARHINALGFSQVRILDVHSEVATRLIRNSTNVLPHKVVDQVRTVVGAHMVVCPDKGAADRVCRLVLSRVVFCTKKRDMATGALTEFEVGDASYVKGNEVLILDDICDGGGTFTGLAAKLREAGATKVNLFVTHGIFSKDLPLRGIDRVFTTDSYLVKQPGAMPYNYGNDVTCIPISMKDL